MKYIRITLALFGLFLLSACGGDDGEKFIGRWVQSNADEIVQISRVDDTHFNVDHLYPVWGNFQKEKLTASLSDDGTLWIGQFGRAEMVGEKLVINSTEFLSVPDGWMPRDGRPKSQ